MLPALRQRKDVVGAAETGTDNSALLLNIWIYINGFMVAAVEERKTMLRQAKMQNEYILCRGVERHWHLACQFYTIFSAPTSAAQHLSSSVAMYFIPAVNLSQALSQRRQPRQELERGVQCTFLFFSWEEWAQGM